MRRKQEIIGGAAFGPVLGVKGLAHDRNHLDRVDQLKNSEFGGGLLEKTFSVLEEYLPRTQFEIGRDMWKSLYEETGFDGDVQSAVYEGICAADDKWTLRERCAAVASSVVELVGSAPAGAPLEELDSYVSVRVMGDLNTFARALDAASRDAGQTLGKNVDLFETVSQMVGDSWEKTMDFTWAKALCPPAHAWTEFQPERSAPRGALDVTSPDWRAKATERVLAGEDVCLYVPKGAQLSDVSGYLQDASLATDREASDLGHVKLRGVVAGNNGELARQISNRVLIERTFTNDASFSRAFEEHFKAVEGQLISRASGRNLSGAWTESAISRSVIAVEAGAKPKAVGVKRSMEQAKQVVKEQAKVRVQARGIAL